jgi:hypothetical protein
MSSTMTSPGHNDSAAKHDSNFKGMVISASPTTALRTDNSAELPGNGHLCAKCRGLLSADSSGNVKQQEEENDFGEMEVQARSIKSEESACETSEAGCPLCRVFVHNMYESGWRATAPIVTSVELKLSQEEIGFNPKLSTLETVMDESMVATTRSATFDLFPATGRSLCQDLILVIS